MRPAHRQVGERVGYQAGADVLLVAEDDDLPRVSARSGCQIDRQPVTAAVVPEDDPAG